MGVEFYSKDKFDEVKKLMSAVDRDALIVLLEE